MPIPNPAELRIIHYPDPILREVCAPVEEFSDQLKIVVERMFEVMRDGRGIGLAAPQVAWPVQLFICNITGEPQDRQIFVNPRLSELTGAVEAEEGCLSFPGVTVTKRRASHVVIDAADLDGQPVRMVGTDLLARVWQHECDHLVGRLVADAMSATDEIANRRALKQLKQEYAQRQRTKK